MYLNQLNSRKVIPNVTEFIEIIAMVAATRTFRSLRWDDLHGCSLEQAEKRVSKAITESVNMGCRTCRIITGRGNHVNAQGNRGVIFENCETWLTSKELAPFIESYEKRVGHYIVKIKKISKFNELEKLSNQEIEFFYEKELSNIRKSADEGDAQAQFLLGCGYALSLAALRCNYKEAFAWFSKAAVQQHGAAQEFVGMFYYVGEGVRQNDKEAMEWLEKAVNNGKGSAAYALSSAYFYGFGCETNIKLSAIWAARGAALKDICSMQRAANLYLEGYPEQSVPRDLEKAIHWYTKAAALGDKYSQFQLGYFYSHGEGVPRDLARGFKWYLLSAKGGDTDAMIAVAICYLRGTGCKSNVEAAVEWIDKADELGHPDAKLIRAEYYEKTGNVRKVMELKQASAAIGSIQAQLQLYADPTIDEDTKYKISLQLLEQPVREITKHAPLYMQFVLSEFLLMKTESSSETKKNNQRGIILLEELAEKKHCEAFLLLGSHFVRVNLNKAIEYWEKGAELGDVDCMFLLGIFYAKSKKIKDAAAKSKKYSNMALEAEHPATLLQEAIEVAQPNPPPDIDKKVRQALSWLLTAIEKTRNVDKISYVNLSLGMHWVQKKAINALLAMLLWRPYLLSANDALIQECLTKLRDDILERKDLQVQYYLGVYLILADSPVVKYREITRWLASIAEDNPNVNKLSVFELCVMFSKHCQTLSLFMEGFALLTKVAQEGNGIAQEIVNIIIQNPFYLGEKIWTLPGFKLFDEEEISLKKYGLSELIAEKMKAHQSYLMECWVQESKERCEAIYSSQTTKEQADKCKGKARAQDRERDQVLFDATMTMTMAENFSRLFQRDTATSSASNVAEASGSQSKSFQIGSP